MERQASLLSLASAVLGGLLVCLLSIVLMISVAGMIFSGDALAPFLRQGIGLCLFGGVALGVAGAFGTSYRGTICHPQDVTGVILALSAAAIAARLGGGSPATLYATVAVLIALASVVTGAAFLAAGALRLGVLARFIPYPVMGGFMAAAGYLMTAGAIRMVTGRSALVRPRPPGGALALAAGGGARRRDDLGRAPLRPRHRAAGDGGAGLRRLLPLAPALRRLAGGGRPARPAPRPLRGRPRLSRRLPPRPPRRGRLPRDPPGDPGAGDAGRPRLRRRDAQRLRHRARHRPARRPQPRPPRRRRRQPARRPRRRRRRLPHPRRHAPGQPPDRRQLALDRRRRRPHLRRGAGRRRLGPLGAAGRRLRRGAGLPRDRPALPVALGRAAAAGAAGLPARPRHPRHRRHRRLPPGDCRRRAGRLGALRLRLLAARRDPRPPDRRHPALHHRAPRPGGAPAGGARRRDAGHRAPGLRLLRHRARAL